MTYYTIYAVNHQGDKSPIGGVEGLMRAIELSEVSDPKTQARTEVWGEDGVLVLINKNRRLA